MRICIQCGNERETQDSHSTIIKDTCESCFPEEWKDIVGYEGRYQVSNLGRVRSLAREYCTPVACKRVPERILKVQENNNGYLYILMRIESKKYKHYIHRLVAAAFLEKPYEDAYEVNHKDKVRKNNHLSNLEWLNHIDNCAHRDEVF